MQTCLPCLGLGNLLRYEPIRWIVKQEAPAVVTGDWKLCQGGHQALPGTCNGEGQPSSIVCTGDVATEIAKLLRRPFSVTANVSRQHNKLYCLVMYWTEKCMPRTLGGGGGLRTY